MPPTLSNATSMWPPRIAVSCAAPPSRCTMRKIAPGTASSTIRIARWSSLRMPVVAARILLGVFLAASTRSLSVLYGLSALTQMTPGSSTWLMIGMKASALNIALRSGSRITVFSRGQVDEADVVAVRPRRGSYPSSRPGRPRRPCSPRRSSGRVAFSAMDATMRAADVRAAARREGHHQLHRPRRDSPAAAAPSAAQHRSDIDVTMILHDRATTSSSCGSSCVLLRADLSDHRFIAPLSGFERRS